VLTVGLTGGIGSGKSTVSRALAELGAVVIDADVIAREVVEPGTPGLGAVVEAFGAGVLDEQGALDRAKLGSLVFADDAARARLSGILHPLIGARTVELWARAEADGVRVLVHDVPLLVESGLEAAYDEVVVVDTTPELQRQRLTQLRGMTAEEADQRIAAQATREQRLAVATRVLRNDGALNSLQDQVRVLWGELEKRLSEPG
jgi:dephospho-CoA kinase